MRVSEIFTSIQGEGIYTGVPSIFVRLVGCNLCCAFKNGSVCDSMFASHPQKSDNVRELEPSQLAREIYIKTQDMGGIDYSNIHVVFTGGEPLLQQNSIIETIDKLYESGYETPITIETNGSIIPDIKLLKNPNILFSVSPKLSSSCCFKGTNIAESIQKAHEKNRINYEALTQICLLSNNYQLKFVYSDYNSTLEIKELIRDVSDYIYKNLISYSNIIKFSLGPKISSIDNHIMLMPEGISPEQLNDVAEKAINACIANGWRFTDRMHIRIWGNERGK